MTDETNRAIDEALEGGPRSGELAEMIAALEVRRETFARERDQEPNPESKRDWSRRIREVEKQLTILRQERAISEFVENSVRVAVKRPNFDLDDDSDG